MLTVQLLLSIYIGIGWAGFGIWVSLMLTWERPARLSVFMLGLLTGIFRIQQAAHDYAAGLKTDTYLLTSDALILNSFIAVAITVLNYYGYKIFRRRGYGA